MKIKDARITFLVSEDKTTIEIKDSLSATTFCKVSLTPVQLSKALSRLSNTECDAEVFGLDRIGKTHENESFEFEIPANLASSSKSKELTELCILKLDELDMSEWKPDEYFGSQTSFYKKDGKQYARAIIRRWI